MTGGKLILICQSGCEFFTLDDGSLSHKGGDAHAININQDTLFEDLKLELAETLNFEYKSMFIKYFLPGNRKILITLASDKDFKRMCSYYQDSVTADVFVTGKEGFDREALGFNPSRACALKLAETVASPSPSPSQSTGFLPTAVATNATGTISAAAADLVTNTTDVPMTPVGPIAEAPANTTANPTTKENGASANEKIIMDMSATPADTVKKRRRTASWKFGAHGPTIVSVADDEHKVNDSDEDDDMTPTWIDNPNYSHEISDPQDRSLENVVGTWKNGITGVGQDFISVKEFRDALQKYAIAHRFVYKLKKNDTNRASARCVDENCTWTIHASWVPSAQVFRIKKMNKLHTCSGESWKSAHPSKSWLVNVIKERLRENPNHRPKEIANEIGQDFGLELSYSQVRRGIEYAKSQLHGPQKDTYCQLPWFCEKMLEANPGSSVNLCISEDGKFQRLFVSFHALKYGFQHGCRPLIYLSAISLGSKYHESLLTATALDGNDDFFPVAYAMVDVENDNNWRWFLEQLKSAVTTTPAITFVSDKEKGLMNPILEIFENAHHGYSLYCLLENFRKTLKGPFHGDGKASLIASFVAAAHAVRLDSFNMYMKQIERVSSKAFNWVAEIEPEYWTNALFKGEYYNQVLVDFAETYRMWIEEADDKPVIQKLIFLGYKITELMNTRRTSSTEWSSKLTPLKEEKIQEEIVKARDLKVFVSSSTLFEVHDDCINVVDIGKLECTCLRWKISGIPCCHAIAALNCSVKPAYGYCSEYFTVDRFCLTYSESMNPVLAVFEENVDSKAATVTVLPPTTPRPSSQKNKREKAIGSEKRRVFCSRCQAEGHNKATCKLVMQKKFPSLKNEEQGC